jgi:hypothetical protein
MGVIVRNLSKQGEFGDGDSDSYETASHGRVTTYYVDAR